MSTNAWHILIGCIVTGGGLVLLTVLLWWSNRTIDRIADRKLGSAREIMKGLRDER